MAVSSRQVVTCPVSGLVAEHQTWGLLGVGSRRVCLLGIYPLGAVNQPSAAVSTGGISTGGISIVSSSDGSAGAASAFSVWTAAGSTFSM